METDQTGFHKRERKSGSPELLAKYKVQVNRLMAWRYRIIVLSGTILFMGYAFVDRLIYPEYQVEFIIMRIIQKMKML